MNILVTGANGQLGSEFRYCVAGSSDCFLFTDIAELDITNLESILIFIKRNAIEVVINCAAYTDVDKAEEDSVVADLINNKAVENLAIACKEFDATLIHVSTDYVFRGENNTPYKEDEPTNSLGVYGKTKLAGEQSIQRVGCNYLIFRTSWLYSSFGNNFVKTIRKLTSERQSLKVIYDQVGTPTYARDLAYLICSILEQHLHKNTSGIYHYSNEGVCSWYDFAKEIIALSGITNCDIQPCLSKEFSSAVKRPHFSVLDKSKVKETFGLPIPYWKESLINCINELK